MCLLFNFILYYFYFGEVYCKEVACSRLLRQAGPEVALVLGQDEKLGEFGGPEEDRSPSLRILVEAALQKIKNNYQLFKASSFPSVNLQFSRNFARIPLYRERASSKENP